MPPTPYLEQIWSWQLLTGGRLYMLVAIFTTFVSEAGLGMLVQNLFELCTYLAHMSWKACNIVIIIRLCLV